MKLLLLMRHAKSDWSSGEATDHERLLNDRGSRVAPQMGELLDERFGAVDRIISSDATRAAKTARLVREGAGWAAPIEEVHELYEAPPSAYLQVLGSVPNEIERLLMVGHNPGIERLILQQTGRQERMPTAAVAVFPLAGDDWRSVALATKWELKEVLRPKEVGVE